VLGVLYRGLRDPLAIWLGGRNDRPDLNAGGIILTLGSVHAIALAINAYVNAGDGVLVESASFPYALRYFQMRYADVLQLRWMVEYMSRGLLDPHIEDVKPVIRQSAISQRL